MISASRPVVGSPSGPVRRMVSRYFRWRFGLEGLSGDASGTSLSEMPSL